MTDDTLKNPSQNQKFHSQKFLRIWLLTVAASIFLMVLIGGATRLTESGLSITEWQPLGGAIPPLSQQDWLELFRRYQTTPQYQLLNHGMELSEFKNIFWWEYVHRLWGRLIGLVMGLPLLWLIMRRQIAWDLGKRLGVIFLLGGAQGAVGWWMVKSGLKDQPWVSPVRLAIHLGLAVILYGMILQIYFSLLPRSRPKTTLLPRIRILGHFVLGLSFITILAGALVAGLRAGLIYNEFPMMGGGIIPEDYWAFSPDVTVTDFLRNASQNPAAVQFHHRILAVSLALLSVIWAVLSYRRSDLPSRRRAAIFVALAVTAQIILGISTLLLSVPIWLGVAHQAGAIILFTAILWLSNLLRERH